MARATIKVRPRFPEFSRFGVCLLPAVDRGDWQKLIAEARDSHWMMAYGNHLAPARYAARKIGIHWVDV